MGQSGALVAIGMAVFIHNFTWADSYFSCGCTTSDDTTLSNVSVWKLVRSFSNGMNEI